MFEIKAPSNREEIVKELERLANETAEFVDRMPAETFAARQGETGEFWSPAEHLRHLATAVRAVAQGMSLPKLMLALRFGRAKGGSASFEEVRARYQAALGAGGKASGQYDPSQRAIDKPPDALRDFVMQRWRSAGEELVGSIGKWEEKDLDRYRAKHPLLGMMTVRELLFFTLYHNAHHARRIREREGG